MGQLDATTKGFIESFHSQLKQMTLFELLGADSDADLTALRRAYHRRSKQIHPDRYYKRVDEQHRAMLERSFRWVHGAFQFLKDERRRVAYREHLRQRRQNAPSVVAVEQDTRLEFIIEDEEDFFSLFPPILSDLIGPVGRSPAPPADGSFEFLSDDLSAPTRRPARRPTPPPDTPDDAFEFVSDISLPAQPATTSGAEPAPRADDTFEFVVDD